MSLRQSSVLSMRVFGGIVSELDFVCVSLENLYTHIESESLAG